MSFSDLHVCLKRGSEDREAFGKGLPKTLGRHLARGSYKHLGHLANGSRWHSETIWQRVPEDVGEAYGKVLPKTFRSGFQKAFGRHLAKGSRRHGGSIWERVPEDMRKHLFGKGFLKPFGLHSENIWEAGLRRHSGRI